MYIFTEHYISPQTRPDSMTMDTYQVKEGTITSLLADALAIILNITR